MSAPTTDLCACAMCTANRALWKSLPTLPRATQPNPAAFEDGEDLRRSRVFLSSSARRDQRRLAPIRVDELGYDKRGRYYPQWDGAA